MTSVEVNTSATDGLTGMETNLPKRKLHFKYLPAYAKFILDNKLHDFVLHLIALSREVNLPLMKLFKSFTQDQLVELGTNNTINSLTFLSENKASELIENMIKSWLNNEIPVIAKEEVVANDLTLVSFIRRKAFRDFLHYYTNDFLTFRNIMEEADEFTTEFETATLNIVLNNQQNLYKHTQAIAHIGNWVWNLKSNKLIWSEELYNIYELPPGSEIDRDNIRACNHPDDQELITRQMKRSLQTNEPHDFYYRIILPGGKEKALHAKGQVLVDAENNPLQFFGTLQDVTEQKRYEKELTEKQSFIQKIADVTPSLIAAYNVNTGKYIFINKALKKLLGYEPEEVLEKGVDFFIPLIHPDDLEPLMKKNAQALEMVNQSGHADDDVIAEFQYRMRNKNGECRWLHTYGTIFSRDNNNKVEYVLNISVDVTEQYQLSKQLEEERRLTEKKNEDIRRSEEGYHRMIAEVQDYAILLLDKEGTIKNWNLGAEKIKGYKSEEIIGKNFRIFYTPEGLQNKRPDKLIEEATKTGRAVDEGWRVRKDGTHFWGSTAITALHDENGNLTGFTKVTRDLSERKMVEEKLKNYAKELEQKNEELLRSNKELESFTYVSSHDLQEPLRKIQIFSNAVLTGDFENLSERGKEYFNRMFSAANRMQQLIEDLLAFSRATSANAEFENVDLNVLLDDVLSNIRASAEESNAIIETEKLPVARVIPFQFRQVLQNLISNSIKYTKPGTPPHIKISAQRIVAKKDKELKPNVKYHKIIVADEGIGFEQQHAEKIFELFQRLHTKEEYQGTGIGLAICKKIIQNHNGAIKAKGVPDKGATFEIYIPVE